MRPCFLIDADDVLVDFVGPAVEAIRHVLGQQWTLDDAPPDTWDMFAGLTDEQLREVDAIIDAPGWCLRLEPYPEAQDAVPILRQLCDLFVVTSYRTHAPQWVYERNICLGTHYGFRKRDIVHTSAKHVCVGDFFLDDNPAQVQGWQGQAHNSNGRGMLWSTEHNRRLRGYEAIREHSWDEVIGRVRAMLARA